MPWFSYHGGHSGSHCRHAKGELAAVVAAAAARGFTSYGLSEHCPRELPEYMFGDEADLTTADLARTFDAYVSEARSLRDTWRDRLELLVGFETEAVPVDGWPARMRELRAGVPDCDYIIGSVHHVGGIGIDYDRAMLDRAAEAAGGREALEIAYFELVARVADELRPEVLGHIDLIRKFDGHRPELTPGGRAACERALEAARAGGCALDVNAAPHRRGLGPIYPLPWVLARACAMGIPVTLGDDSHGPDDVGVGLDACVEAIGRAGYRSIHYLTRRDGAVALVPAAIEDVGP